MISEAEAIIRARAYLARDIELISAEWPQTVYNAPERPGDYLVFWASRRMLGGAQYVAVHKVTGDVLDLGHHGE